MQEQGKHMYLVACHQRAPQCACAAKKKPPGKKKQQQIGKGAPHGLCVRAAPPPWLGEGAMVALCGARVRASIARD